MMHMNGAMRALNEDIYPVNMGNITKSKVFVAMSGGVDSSVAAWMLKEQGHDVVGVHIKMWSDPSIPCNFKEDRHDAMRAAEKIGIPFQTWDFTLEYKSAVVEYMIREYALGRTPNPDVMCNRHVKFGVFLARALSLGADFIATGHYVRREPEFPISNFQFPNSATDSFENSHLENSLHIKNCTLKIAKDVNKDQSYFLWTLTQEQLRYCMFPLGDLTKPEVREMARAAALPNAEKKDSQGICFIGEIDLNAFLKKHIPESRGPIMTTTGMAVGEHDGLSFYTIGQREGLGLGDSPSSKLRRSEGGIPYYVAGKDFKTNTLVVSEGPYDEGLFKQEVEVADVNWISSMEPRLPLTCEARIRYRQPLQECRMMKQELGMKKNNSDKSLIHNSRFLIQFSEPQRAVTPGQSIVFYLPSEALAKEGEGEEMLGGAIIT